MGLKPERTGTIDGRQTSMTLGIGGYRKLIEALDSHCAWHASVNCR